MNATNRKKYTELGYGHESSSQYWVPPAVESRRSCEPAWFPVSTKADSPTPVGTGNASSSPPENGYSRAWVPPCVMQGSVAVIWRACVQERPGSPIW